MDLANFVGLAGVIENTFRGGSFSSLEEIREKIIQISDIQ